MGNENSTPTSAVPPTSKIENKAEPEPQLIDDFKDLGGPVRVIIIGAGSRGRNYAQYAAEFPNRMKVVAVAEPVQFHRENLANAHEIPEKFRYKTWEEIKREEIEADAVVISVWDKLHKDIAVAMARQKFHILLEKPMAVTLPDCQEIVKAVEDAGVLMAVCHVLRYSPCNREVKRLLESGAIGEVVNIQHLEPVGNWHFAHSYVRGNWRREDESCFSLMTKSCHDIDLLVYWMGIPPKSVQSFGRLSHFKKEKKPEEAKDALRCLDCDYEPKCAYSSKLIYLKPYREFVRVYFILMPSNL
jgi:predicted dehydrogenase